MKFPFLWLAFAACAGAHVLRRNRDAGLQQSSSFMSQNSKELSAAVCCTGHLRTFGLPGMYSNFVKNLLESGAKADLYFVGHLGKFSPTDPGNGEKHPTEVDILSADDPSWKRASSFLGNHAKYVALTDGSCDDLEKAWAADGIMGRRCRNEDGWAIDSSTRTGGAFYQIMWLDHCIHQAMGSGNEYDVLVRTRPDIGIFAPVPWTQVDTHKLNVLANDNPSHADWFFVAPWSFLNTWWASVVTSYNKGEPGYPDYVIFNFSSTETNKWLKVAQFPAIIVRGPKDVECFRLHESPAYRKTCEQTGPSDFFLKEVGPTTSEGVDFWGPE